MEDKFVLEPGYRAYFFMKNEICFLPVKKIISETDENGTRITYVFRYHNQETVEVYQDQVFERKEDLFKSIPVITESDLTDLPF